MNGSLTDNKYSRPIDHRLLLREEPEDREARFSGTRFQLCRDGYRVEGKDRSGGITAVVS